MLRTFQLGFVLSVGMLSFIVPATGQDRDTKVRNDREQVTQDDRWIYNDLDAGRSIAEAQGKPMLVVLRCIP